MLDLRAPALNDYQRMVKRSFDLLLGIPSLIFGLPFMGLIALAIKVDSPGPALFIQHRVGENGKLFWMYKFRSMILEAEKDKPIWAESEDARVTPFGRFIRKIRIDEIPQFINVLKNEMSIVGPRPERPFFVNRLKKEIPYYSKRLSIKPGITGWAQVKLSYDTSVEDVKDKLQYDFYYIENMSLALDFKIMINTIFVVFLMKGQ